MLFRWVVGVWQVVKLTSSDLLDRLRKKGTRNPEFTRGLICEKLNDDDEVGIDSLKVTVSCPLGKMRMQVISDVTNDSQTKLLLKYPSM